MGHDCEAAGVSFWSWPFGEVLKLRLDVRNLPNVPALGNPWLLFAIFSVFAAGGSQLRQEWVFLSSGAC